MLLLCRKVKTLLHGVTMSKSEGLKVKDPDRGPPMKEGPHQFDKGYMSDSERFSPDADSSDDNYRGNNYFKLQNEIVGRDDKKIKRSKFSKIA